MTDIYGMPDFLPGVKLMSTYIRQMMYREFIPCPKYQAFIFRSTARIYGVIYGMFDFPGIKFMHKIKINVVTNV